MQPDMFGKYNLRLTGKDAMTLLELVQGIDYENMDTSNLLALNMLQAGLEMIVDAHLENDQRAISKQAFNNAFGIDVEESLNKLNIRKS